MKKMPLGKLSRRQIESAYSVLSELQREIAGERRQSKVLDCTNRFYTLVPHDFGMGKPPPLDSEEVIKIKTQMLDNLLEIEVAYSLLKQEEGVAGGKDPLDVHYEQLKTKLEVIVHTHTPCTHMHTHTHTRTHTHTHTQTTTRTCTHKHTHTHTHTHTHARTRTHTHTHTGTIQGL